MTVRRAGSFLKPSNEDQVDMLSLSSKETESVTDNLAQFKFYIDLLKQYRCLVS